MSSSGINRLSAEGDYHAGMSLSEIARKYGVAIGTVKNWSSAGGWKDKKIAGYTNVIETVFDRVTDTAERNVTAGLNFSAYIFEAALEGVKREDRRNPKALKEWCEVAVAASRIYTSMMPSVPNDVGDRMLSELIELRAKMNGTSKNKTNGGDAGTDTSSEE